MARGARFLNSRRHFPAKRSARRSCLNGAGRRLRLPCLASARVAVLQSRPGSYECLDCGRQTSITAGTAMHRSRPPLTTWFWAAHLMATISFPVGATTGGPAWRHPQDRLAAGAEAAAINGPPWTANLSKGSLKLIKRKSPSAKATHFSKPGNAGKIPTHRAVEVIDRDSNQARPRRKHAKYLDNMFGRIRLAMIADNSAASIEAFVKANVKPGTTLLTDGHASYPGLTGYRHDPRVVGKKMAGHVVLRPGFSLGPLAAEAMEPRHLSRSAPGACRYLSQRVRFSLQPPFLPARLFDPLRLISRQQRTRDASSGTSSSETIHAKRLLHPAHRTHYKMDEP